eukprot:10182943-Ditylum_brightwellii.AAC.1
MRGEILDTKGCSKGIKKKLSRNAINQKKNIKEKFGIKIPRNTKEALLLGKKNGDRKWVETICKEVDACERLGVFQYHDARTKFHKIDGWQYAPMHMSFDIKHDLHRQTRFVVRGYAIDLSKHTTYSSMIKNISVRLVMLVAAKYWLGMISGDIGNDFYTVHCAEKIWSVAGEQLGDKKGAIKVVK